MQALVDDLAAEGSPSAATPAAAAIAAGPDAVGGDPSNTPPTNRQEGGKASGKALIRGGLDWLKVSCYGSWKARDWHKVQASFDEAKRQSQVGPGPGTVELPDGDVLAFADHGVRKAGLWIEWVFQWQGMTFLVTKRPVEHETLPSVIVDIPSLVLMQLGHVLAWQLAKRLLADLGFELSRNVAGRGDPCVDLAGVPVRGLVKSFAAGECVRRARKGSVHFDGTAEDVQTLTLGVSGIKLRAYDKLAELSRPKPENEEKLELLTHSRWGGEVPESATRVEFQLDREALRDQFGVESVEDLFAKLPAICEWLTLEWFRLTDGLPDRANGHEKRAELHPLWKLVREAFQSWAGQSDEAVQPRERKAPKQRPLWNSLLGCLSSVAAAAGCEFSSLIDVREWVWQQLRPKINEEFMDQAAAKAICWQALGPGRGPVWAEAIPF